MEDLKRQRQTIKGALTRIHNYVANTEISFNEVKVRAEKADELFKQFENLQKQIDALIESEELAASEESYVTEIENKYFSIKLIYNNKLDNEGASGTTAEDGSLNGVASAMQTLIDHQSTMSVLIERMTNTRSDTTSSPLSQQQQSQHEIRLPQIQLPDFDGTCVNWIRFRDLFEAMVHTKTNISDIEKLEYLQTKLKGEALSLIKHLRPTSANYEIAWQLIKKKYDKSDKVKKAYLELLFDQPSMKSSSVNEVKRFYNNTNESFNALKVLNEPVKHWDSILLFHMEKKLDSETNSLWYRDRNPDTTTTFQQFLDFLEKRVFELENTQKSVSHTANQNTTSQKRFQQRTYAAVVQSCPICSRDHFLYHCDKFKAMEIDARYKILKKHNICFNCLQPNHQALECKRSSCRVCNAKHNTLLHPKADVNEKYFNQQEILKHQASTSTNTTSCINVKHQQHIFTILPTAVILIQDSSSTFQPCRALLDSGSQSTLITEACVQRLKLKRIYDKTILYGVGSGNGNITRGKVQIQINSSYCNKNVTTEAFCLTNLTQNLPGQNIESDKVEFFKQLQLADPAFDYPGTIDVILGADIFAECVLHHKIVHPSGSPSALNTIFGWIVVGKITVPVQSNITSAHVYMDLDKQLQRFWQCEEIQPPAHFFTPEEEQAEQHFKEHTQRDNNGRYVVKLPLKSNNVDLGNSREAALKRLYAMERRFACDHKLKEEYTNFIHEFANLDHMEIATDSPPSKTYFMPHHAVRKSSSTTTKLRVVFDASCKTTNGLSLNDHLLTGPTIQNDLFEILLKFRKYKIGLTGDIEKMYRQVIIHPADRSLQRILWRDSKDEQPKEYNLKTVTYGTSAAPFLATRTLKQLSYDCKESYPEVAVAISQNFYVDDFMYCATDLQSATTIRKDICDVLSSAGFHLRKWSSNSSSFLETIELHDRETATETIIDDTQTVKTLGLLWNTTDDSFKYSICLSETPTKVSKRSVLSDISKIFDPLGFLSPVIVKMKIFMQKLWLRGLEWDQELPIDLRNHWFEFREKINRIKELQIPRWLQFANEKNVELHGFADSSELAYSAAIYLRVLHTNGQVFTNLIASKTRVAPVKQITLPRLELCAAHLMTKLITKIQSALELADAKVIGWTDSTVVLAWIADHPRRWKSFIANRTSEIINVIPAQQWRHIRSQHNPADLATRGICPTEIIDRQLWWHGPDVLRHPCADYQIPDIPPDIDMEERKESVTHAVTVTEIELTSRYSDFVKLNRIGALILRFVQNCRRKKLKVDITTGFLTSIELQAAHDAFVKRAQMLSYGAEIRCMMNDKQLPSSNKLSALAPFIDDKGLLRVGGRIINANVSYDQKHPLILHKDHHLTTLIVREYHIRNLHAGNRQLQYLIGLKYWIPCITYVIKRCIYKCTTCMKFRAIPYQQQMGNLPQHRLEPGTAFLNTGVDYAGPILVRSWKGRGSKQYKCWIVLFICLVTKAIHLDLVSELSTAAFIAVFRRFVARRGKPSHMYSDNGTNFVGARMQLQEFYQFLNATSVQEGITKELAEQEIQWHFSPPSGPHFGGMWEAGIKSTKHHLKRVLGNSCVTFEELYTTLCQIESCLNSRPLCNKFEGDIDPLTPAHFLILRPMATVPDEKLLNVNVNRLKRWQYVQQLVQQFWHKWSTEYISQLQQRPKWSQKLRNLQVNDVVLIKDENLPPSHWTIGRVTETYPGADQLVRVVSVTTSKGTVKRPITKLCPLFLDI